MSTETQVINAPNVEKETTTKLSTKRDVNWAKVLFQIQMTLSALCAMHFLLYDSQWKTIFFGLFTIFLGHIGVAAGAHRLWTHNAYTAHGALKFFLLFCQTLSGTGSVYDWVQWHRLHHKYFGTELDPYNPTKGWLYAQIHGVTLYLSPAQVEEMKKIDMSDLNEDKMVMFQKKWYPILYAIFVLLLPINAPAEYWGENVFSSVFILGWLRMTISLQMNYLINSATLIWGLQPGERYPCDTNWVFILTKSHWCHYHYLAPYDYQTSEYGQYGSDTVSKFIRVCAALELAWDLKVVSPEATRRALTLAVKQDKDVKDALWECAQEDKEIPKDHYLEPAKYYK